MIGIPWLVFIGVASFDHVGRFSLYSAGDDFWTFQRLAYRIFLQGYWLEGGEITFWFQPGYRWIAGAWHMVFGDSSIGEFFWDGACLLAIALFVHEATRRFAGFRWGLIGRCHGADRSSCRARRGDSGDSGSRRTPARGSSIWQHSPR